MKTTQMNRTDENTNGSCRLQQAVDESLVRAKMAGRDGVPDPHSLVFNTQLACEQARDGFEGQLEQAAANISSLENELQTKHRALEETDQNILRNWNEKPRLVRDRAEAKAAQETYCREMNVRVDGWQILVYILFAFEFAFGYWIFKTFVLPDPGWGNELTSVLIGGMTVVIGFLLKLLPDSTRDIVKFGRAKKALGYASALSALTFIILLAYIRQTSDSLVPVATEAAGGLVNRGQEFRPCPSRS